MALAELEAEDGSLREAAQEAITERGERMLASNVALSVVERLATAAVGYVTLIVIVRHLTVADFGILSLSTNFIGPFGAAAEFGLSGLLVRTLIEQPDRASRILSSFTALWLCMCGAALVVFLGVTLALRYPVGVAVPVALYGSVTLITFPLSSLNEYLVATARVYQASLSNLVVSAATLGVVYVVIGRGVSVEPVWLLVLIVACMNGLKLLAGAALAWRHVRIGLAFEPREWRAYLLEGWPLAGASLILSTFISSGTTILSKVSTLDEVAMYGVATRQIPLMNFFPLSLLTSIFPVMCGYYARGARRELDRVWGNTLRQLVLYGVTAVAFGWAFAPDAVRLVYGAKYAAAAPILVWSVAYSAIFGLTIPYNNLLIAAHLQLRRFIIHCVALPLLIVGAVVLGSREGALGLVQALRRMFGWPWEVSFTCAAAVLAVLLIMLGEIPLPRAWRARLPWQQPSGA